MDPRLRGGDTELVATLHRPHLRANVLLVYCITTITHLDRKLDNGT